MAGIGFGYARRIEKPVATGILPPPFAVSVPGKAKPLPHLYVTQREVTDNQKTTWTCVQAYGGLEGEKAEKAAALSENGNGQVPVVCTPGGGAQTVRLELPKNWLEDTSDEELLASIVAAQEEAAQQK